MMSTLLNSAVFPGTQGGPLEHTIAAKAVAFGEALSDEFFEYSLQVKKNTHALAEALLKKDYNIISGGTVNHCFLIDLKNKNITGKEAEKALMDADITVNKNMIPFDEQSPFITSGIRIGAPAITTRGLKEQDMSLVADFIDRALMAANDDLALEELAEEINAWMGAFPLFA